MSSVDERRGAPRKRTLKAAKIVFGDFRYTIDCVVRDLNKGGARLRCPAPGDAPSEFYLLDVTEGTLLKSEVAWRKDSELGIRFTGEVLSVHASSDPRLARFKFV